MKNIFKYVLGAIAIYCTVNWLADNPTQINTVRHTMNKTVKRTQKCINDF